jgi:hypothetical protein
MLNTALNKILLLMALLSLLEMVIYTSAFVAVYKQERRERTCPRCQRQGTNVSEGNEEQTNISTRYRCKSNVCGHEWEVDKAEFHSPKELNLTKGI